jgi:hypothetical protein
MSNPVEITQVRHHILKWWRVSVGVCETGLHSAAGQAVCSDIDETVDWYVWDMVCDSVYFEITDHLYEAHNIQ